MSWRSGQVKYHSWTPIETIIGIAIFWVLWVVFAPPVRMISSVDAMTTAADRMDKKERLLRDFLYTQLSRIAQVLEVRNSRDGMGFIRFRDSAGNIQICRTGCDGNLYYGRCGEMEMIGGTIQELQFYFYDRNHREVTVEDYNRYDGLMRISLVLSQGGEDKSSREFLITTYRAARIGGQAKPVAHWGEIRPF